MAREKLGQFLRTLNAESSADSISYTVDTRGNSEINSGNDTEDIDRVISSGSVS